MRYANDSFSPTFITTIGIDFKIKNIELDGKRIKLQVSQLGLVLHDVSVAMRCFYILTHDVSFISFRFGTRLGRNDSVQSPLRISGERR